MILSEMSTKTILSIFWKDYKETIQKRLFGWIGGHKKEIKGRGWVKLKDIRHVKLDGNDYRNVVTTMIDKSGGICFITTTYLIVRGEKDVVFLLPTEEKSQSLISFSSHFFYRWSDLFLGHNLPFSDLVDEFMKTGVNFKASVVSDRENEALNFYVDLGLGRIGIGKCDLEEKRFNITTCLSKENIETWRSELGLGEDKNCLEIYLAWKSRQEKPKQYIELKKELTEKEREIELAWREYYGR